MLSVYKFRAYYAMIDRALKLTGVKGVAQYMLCDIRPCIYHVLTGVEWVGTRWGGGGRGAKGEKSTQKNAKGGVGV